MKLLTLNTHSLIEPDYEKKLKLFAEMIQKEQPEVFALQEVNQTRSLETADIGPDTGYILCHGYEGPVRKDNHAFCLAVLLKEMGCSYQWTWVPAKLGYGIYEEGLSLFSLLPIDRTEQFFISRSHDFFNWKTRKMLAVHAGDMWFASVHMGWWEDEEEPFRQHWNLASEKVRNLAGPDGTVWVMGDFNSPAGLAEEGFDYVKSSGWLDSYELAEEKDDGITVGKVIDGWKGRLRHMEQHQRAPQEDTQISEQKSRESAGIRIDYIWCSKKVKVISSKVVCNGIFYPVVSDHYGVMAEWQPG